MFCHSPQTRLQLPRTLGLRWIGKSVFRFNLKSGFRILQSNAKSENGFYLREIRPQGGFQLRNPNPDFMDFRFTILLGNLQKDSQNCSRERRSFLLLTRARARTLFLRTVFQILFPIFQSNGKNENPKTDISALKSVFGFHVRFQIRNPDFKIKIQISQSNEPSWTLRETRRVEMPVHKKCPVRVGVSIFLFLSVTLLNEACMR